MDEGRLGEEQRGEKMGKGGRNRKLKRIETERRKSGPETSRCQCYGFGSREQRDEDDQALKGH